MLFNYKEMESRNKLTMCRLCLSENECLINIFKLNDCQGYVAADVISDLLQFQVSETDRYPHVVCSECLMKLTDFKVFKECCQRSKVKYDNMFVSSKSLEEYLPEMDIGEYGSGLELCEQDPLRDAVIKQEELDIDSSVDESDEPFEAANAEASFGPIILKHEVISLNRDNQIQEEGEERVTVPERETARGNGRFECHCCRKVLTTKEGLKTHLAGHGIGMHFKCGVCGKICLSRSNLIRHSRTHTGERPYECTYCLRRFKHSNSLKYHVRIHMNAKPFKCVECDLSFRQRGTLKTHMKLHSDAKPYSCELCRASFRHKHTLKNHLESCSRKLLHECM